MRKHNGTKLLLLTLTLLGTLDQRVLAEENNPPVANSQDPYESFNRPMFTINEWLDKLLFRPAAAIYNKIIPKPLSKGFSNAYNNIDTIPTIINDLLQGNLYQSVNDAWRLGINTTIGVLGFFDVATSMGLEPNNKQDFGLTLAHWGWTESNYLVLPVLGPGTVRDQFSIPFNTYMMIYPYIGNNEARYGLFAGSIIVRRAELLRYENVMDDAALDKYTFVRDAYLQRRRYIIERNQQLANPYLESTQSTTDPSSSAE